MLRHTQSDAIKIAQLGTFCLYKISKNVVMLSNFHE